MTEDIVQAQHNWLKISSVCDMAAHRLGVSVPHYFRRFLEIAKWELLNLHLDRANEVKTVLLDITDLNTCLLPSDCISICKVGVQDGQFVKTIGINDDLSKIDRTPGVPEFSRTASPGWIPNGVTIQSYDTGIYFNYGGRSLPAIDGGLPHEGHYQIVSRPGYKEILLDGNIKADKLYVEYVGLGINPCGETILDPYFADYILKSILAVYEEEINPRRTEASIARRKREQAFAFTLVSGRTNSIDKDTLLIITRKAYRLTNKA